MKWVERAVVAASCGLFGLGSTATSAAAQAWRLEIGPVKLDHDPPPTLSTTGEQIPRGLRLSVSHAWESGPALELEVSRGTDDRFGAICGGFIYDPASQCIGERVGYSGGAVALTGGWQLRVDAGSAWWFAVEPRAGLGVVWLHEAGRATGRAFSEGSWALLAGVDLQVARSIPHTGLSVIASVGADQLRPLPRPDCLDCRRELHEPLPQTRVGLAIGWRRR